MSRGGPKIEFNALTRSVKEIEARFLTPHLGPPTLSAPSRLETLDVAACMVLVHGALENFVEGLAQWAFSKAVQNWIYRKKTSRVTASLLLYEQIPDDTQPSVFDNIRKSLEDAKTRMSKVVHDNHGISPNNLRALFMPLGVNVPRDPLLIASLELLITIRHQWAHQDRNNRTKITRSAADAQTTIADCLTFAKKLSEEVASVRP